ncbi:hypothetical protein [uncultured Hyphomicrobium sp.]|uniref:hypothetical protein n=1 Tax=uncultured Hyphomicrobium sp. TaxID=194373 RepID=UPI0025EB9CFA|nr:hypothetical protein [uncultured Hyphomicrobium sp.]
MATLGATLPRAEQALDVLATARTNNRTQSLTFRVPAHQSRVSELRIRSGSLAITLVGLEIAFRDGGTERFVLQGALAPGHQSQPIPVDPSRTIREVLVTKQPGLRPGETAIQLLGKVQP